MKQIDPIILTRPVVTIPGSKSISHRMMICAAMARGRSIIHNALESDDLAHTRAALSSMGAVIKPNGDGAIHVTGFAGRPGPSNAPIYLGNSGTSMRLMAGVAALGESPYILTGDKRMQERPMGELLAALEMIGIQARAIRENAAPPVEICGGSREGGRVTIDCSQSSQYLSALLLAGGYMKHGLDIRLPVPAVSVPYVHLTINIMSQFGVKARRIDETRYEVSGSQVYQPGEFTVEPDISNAGYFWALGAVSEKPCLVVHTRRNSLQGDIRLLDIFEKMGCRVMAEDKGISVCGNDRLDAVDVDMSDIPDVVPTLAAVACFARGTTRIRRIAHLRQKECDRISAVVSQLRKLGVNAREGEDWLSVTGPADIQPARIETFNDHRIAMAFSVIGLRAGGVTLEDETCVTKSFPDFWDRVDQLSRP